MVTTHILALLLCLQKPLIDVPAVTVRNIGAIPEYASVSAYGGSALLSKDGKATFRPRFSMLIHSDTLVAFVPPDRFAREYELAQLLSPAGLRLGTKNQWMYQDQQGTLPARSRWTRVDHQVLDASSLDNVVIAHSDWGGDLERMSDRVGGISRISLSAQDASSSQLIYRPEKGCITHAVASRDGSEFLARVTVHGSGVESHTWRIVSIKGAARDVVLPKDWLAIAFDNRRLVAILHVPDTGSLARYDFKSRKLVKLPNLPGPGGAIRLVALGDTLIVSATSASYELASDHRWRVVSQHPILASSRDGNRLVIRDDRGEAVLVERR